MNWWDSKDQLIDITYYHFIYLAYSAFRIFSFLLGQIWIIGLKMTVDIKPE